MNLFSFTWNLLIHLVIALILVWFILFIAKVILVRNKKHSLSPDSTILITGGCQGIGFEMAKKFARAAKCNILIWDIEDQIAPKACKMKGERLKIQEIGDLGGKGYFYKCDVSSKQEIYKNLAEVMAKFGSVDIVINNAGVMTGKSFENISNEEFEQTFDVNFFAPIRIMKEIIPIMNQQKSGHIVNICSSAAHFYSCDSSDYCSSKAALYFAHCGVRTELKRSKSPITTTIACPSAISTGLMEGFITPDIIKPIFPWYKPEEAGNLLYEGIIYKEEEISFPFYHLILFRLLVTLPSYIADLIIVLITKNSFSKFVGRKKKN